MRKQPEIKVVAYVRVGDQLVNVDELDDEKRCQLGTWLKSTYLNELYRGKATFKPLEEK